MATLDIRAVLIYSSQVAELRKIEKERGLRNPRSFYNNQAAFQHIHPNGLFTGLETKPTESHIPYYKNHFAIRRACFARRRIDSSCVCESRSPRLTSGGLRPPYPAIFLGSFFPDSPVKCGGYLFSRCPESGSNSTVAECICRLRAPDF